MSPKAKVERSGESGDETVATPVAPAEPVPAEPVSAVPASADPSPFDSEEFLAANRRNRDKLRAQAESKQVRGTATAGSTRRWVVPVLSVLLVAALVAAGVFAYLYREADGQAAGDGRLDKLRPVVAEAAGEYAQTLLTYDSANFAELDTRIGDISTPAFAKDFIEGSRQAREGSVNAEAVSSARVKEAAVQSISSTDAVVLVAMDQTVKSPQTDAQLPEGIPYQSMVKVSLEYVDGRWLLADFGVV